jgi:methionyl aminopeptidase
MVYTEKDFIKFVNSSDGKIRIHTPSAFEGMRVAGRLGAETLDYITPYVKAGVTTLELNDLCHEFIIKNGGIPAPLNYKGFPKSICTSINHVICHGIPDGTKLKDGDILNIDVTPTVDGWHGDTSRMFIIGKPNRKLQRLVDATFECMWKGIEAVKPGAKTGDIGHAIQTYIKPFNYGIVRDFCGHGLGKIFHEAPSIMHYGKPGTGITLETGMFFTIEPMINIGTHESRILPDKWTAITKDYSLSAQFEHSLAVTDDGFEVFTRSPKGLDKPPYSE